MEQATSFSLGKWWCFVPLTPEILQDSSLLSRAAPESDFLLFPMCLCQRTGSLNVRWVNKYNPNYVTSKSAVEKTYSYDISLFTEFKKIPQKLSLSSSSLLRLWSWSNEMSNSSWFPPPISLPVCNTVFQSIKHNHVTVYMDRLLSPLHCIISWVDVSPLYKTPGVCIIYCSGPAKSSPSLFTELQAGLAHHSSEHWGWGRGSACAKMETTFKEMGFLMEFTAREISPQGLDVSLHRMKACPMKNPYRFSNALLEDLKSFNAILEVWAVAIPLSGLPLIHLPHFFKYRLYFGIQFCEL